MTGLQVQQSAVLAARRRAWLSQLRTACVVVSEQPPYLISSISVTQHFAGVSSEERRELLALASRLAGEYGLTAELMDRGTAVTVWLGRPAVSQEAVQETSDSISDGTKLGLFGRLRRLLRLQPATERGASVAEGVPSGTDVAAGDERSLTS